MSHSKILVDTNAYLRLAKTIRPLLFVPFGENKYCLYILPELNDVQVMPTLELLKVMQDCGHVDMKTIDGLCEYWRYSADLPANFAVDYKRLFSKE